jgi:hypothetical protein
MHACGVLVCYGSGPLAEPAPRHPAESAESAETYNVTDQKRQKDPAHRSTRCIQFVSKGFPNAMTRSSLTLYF